MSLQDIEVPVNRLYDELNAFKSKYDTGYIEIIKFLPHNINKFKTFKDQILDDTPGYKAQVKALTPIIIQLKNGFRGEETFYSYIINKIYDILIIILGKLESYNREADITDEMCLNLSKINSLKQKINNLLSDLDNLKESVRGIDNMVSRLFSQIKSPLGGMGRSDIKQIIENQEKLIGEHESKLPGYDRTLIVKIITPQDKINEYLVTLQKKCGNKVRFTDGKLMKAIQFSAQEGFLGSPNIQMLLMQLCKSTNYRYPTGLDLWKTIVASEKDGDNTILMRAVKSQKLEKIQLLKKFPILDPLIITNGYTALTLACSEQSEKTIIKELWVIPFIKNKDRKNENYRNAFIYIYKSMNDRPEYINYYIDLIYWIFFKVEDKFKINFTTPTLLINTILNNISDDYENFFQNTLLKILLYKNYDIYKTNDESGIITRPIDIIKQKNPNQQSNLFYYAASGAFDDKSPLFGRIISEFITIYKHPINPDFILPKDKQFLIENLSNYILPIGQIIKYDADIEGVGGGGGSGGSSSSSSSSSSGSSSSSSSVVVANKEYIFSGILIKNSVPRHAITNENSKHFTINQKIRNISDIDDKYEFETIYSKYTALKSECSIKLITHIVNKELLDLIIHIKWNPNPMTIRNPEISKEELEEYFKLYDISISNQGGGFYNKYQKYFHKYNLLF
jgi:hypothetical protein